MGNCSTSNDHIARSYTQLKKIPCLKQQMLLAQLQEAEQKRGDLAKSRKQLEIRVSPKGTEPVIQEKAETAVPSAELAKEVVDTVSPPKVDFATDLFYILVASSVDDLWAGFHM
ncbi:hypothetical protein Tco_1247425 [Tanacetum coccineum]